MNLLINKKYMVLPINNSTVKKRLEFYSEGSLILDIDAHIDMVSPKYYSYLNIERFIGKEADIKIDPDINFNFSQVNNIPDINLYNETYRPKMHFTAKCGWLNDPNGLVYANGIYHMFFQHNPAGTEWGNMHWGHAISTDLLHWQELDDALYPDEMGTMFSGSAVVDINNKTGLKEDENDVILLFYTAAGNTSKLSSGKQFTQCLAYSTDNGRTFKKYDKNPVIPHVTAQNRDPKVIYSKELAKYILALYGDGNTYMLFVSENLLEWEKLQEIELPDDAECPDFYPLPVNNDFNNIKWIITGASDTYIVGNLKKGYFTKEQETKYFQYGIKTSYAAQTFSNIENEKHRIKIAWDRMTFPDSVFNCQMGFPSELSLKKFDEDYYLCGSPINEIKQLYLNTNEFFDIALSEDKPFIKYLNNKAYDVLLQAPFKENNDFSIDIFGINIKCNLKENQIICIDKKAPLSLKKDKITLRFIIDTAGIELYINDGLFYVVSNFICDYNLNYITLNSSQNALINKISISELSNI
ncbi:MAG: hypothetical protein K0S55_1442 [Clostridia bacterium]|nr:hypothetical protein [Clostridia bacterium]